MDILSRIINKGKRTGVYLIFNLGLAPLILNKNCPNKILMYHGVDTSESKKFNQRHIGFENFKKQILFLKNNANIISVQDFFEQKFKPNTTNIALTFDDGFLNNLKYVVPFLNQEKIPATIYVTGINQSQYNFLWPDFLDIASYYHHQAIVVDGIQYSKNAEGKYFSKDTNSTLAATIKKKGDFEFKTKVFDAFQNLGFDLQKQQNDGEYWHLMTDAQIAEVDQSKYVKIGSHAFWHNNLGNINFDDACAELKLSKNYLENLLQREVKELAYPDGSYSPNILNFAESIGFKYQLAADGYLFPEDKNDLRIVDRPGLYPATSWCNQMLEIFNGKR